MYRKFEINQTKIKGSCQSERKVVIHNSKSYLPLVTLLIMLRFPDLPSVSLKMSSTLDGDLIRKGDTVYLQCEVKANPSVHTIHWTFEVGSLVSWLF